MADRYEKIRKVLAECRDIAMEWTLRGRIPECGKFGEIAQDLDAVCAELEATDPERAQQPLASDEDMVERIAALLYEEEHGEPWTVAGVEHPVPDRDYYRELAHKIADIILPQRAVRRSEE